MRDLKKQNGASREAEHSAAVAGTRSNVVPMYPCWPPAELPERECVLPQVGVPNPIAHDSGYES